MARKGIPVLDFDDLITAIQTLSAPSATNVAVDPTGMEIITANNSQGALKQLDTAVDSVNASLTNLVHTQSGSGSYGVNDTLQIDSNILNHSVIVICCGRYGYGNSIVLSSGSIAAGFYNNGIGAYINSSRHVTLKVSTTGLITVIETNDALNMTIIGLC